MRTATRRRGFGLPELIVVLLIGFALVLAVAMALPRMREGSRVAGCQRNLMQIGLALSVYTGGAGAYPPVPAWANSDDRHPAPLEAMLVEMGQFDFSGFVDPEKPPARRPGVVIGPRVVPGFLCPADPIATAGRFAAPVGYRANAGSTPAGVDGPFAPGRVVTPKQVAAGDGLAYTAGFAERLVGTGVDRQPDLRNYQEVGGTIAGDCFPRAPNPYRGDAGRSWLEPDWCSALYNHALTPNAAPSCLSPTTHTARMGASSGHLGRVHVLLLDGSVRPFTPTIAPGVWAKWGRYEDRQGERIPDSPDSTPPEAAGGGRSRDDS